jgi:hypothetical protein
MESKVSMTLNYPGRKEVRHMGYFGETDNRGRVMLLLHPEEAQALLANLDLPEEEPEEDDEDRYLTGGEEDQFQADKYSLRKRLERAADGRSAPSRAAGSPGTEQAALEYERGY